MVRVTKDVVPSTFQVDSISTLSNSSRMLICSDINFCPFHKQGKRQQ